MTALRKWIPVLALTAGLGCASAPVAAQPYGNARGWHGQHDGRLADAWNDGYRAGFDRGRADVRSRRYDYRRDGDYRDGTRGYDRHRGDRDDYRRAFQQGFAAGYDDAYYGRSVRRAPGPDYGRYPAYPPAPAYPSYPPSAYPTYPGYPGGAGYGYGYSEATDRGYREGLDKGRDDGHDRHAYDPRGEKWYRQGDRGYKKEYGPREQYKAAYRDAFLRGYDEGYRRY
jgi:hypothetical protein